MINERLKLSPDIQLVMNEIRTIQIEQRTILKITTDIDKKFIEIQGKFDLLEQGIINIEKRLDLEIKHIYDRLNSHEKEHKWQLHTFIKVILSFIFGGGIISFFSKFWVNK